MSPVNLEANLVLAVIRQTVNNGCAEGLDKIGSFAKVGWDRLAELLRYHELTTFAYPVFKGRKDLLPARIIEAFKNDYYCAIIENQCKWGEFLRIIRAFRDERLDLLPIKGISLSGDIYLDNPVRPMADIDILIKRKNLGSVRALFRRLGYDEELSGFKEEYWLDIKHQVQFKIHNQSHHAFVEAHFGLGYIESNQNILDSFWGRAKEFSIGGEKILFPSPEDNLIILALHQRIFGKSLCLKYALDVALLLKKYKEEFDWEYLLRVAKKYRISGSLFFLLGALDVFKIMALPSDAYRAIPLPRYKKRLIKRFIGRSSFTDNISLRMKSIYLKSYLLLFDSWREPLGYILNIPKEHFSRFYGIMPYGAKADLYYRFRFLIFFKSAIGSLIGRKAA